MDFAGEDDEPDSFPGFAVFSPDDSSSDYNSPTADPRIIISSLPDAGQNMDFAGEDDEPDSFPGFAVFSPDDSSSDYNSPTADPRIIISSLPDASDSQLHPSPPAPSPAYTEQVRNPEPMDLVGFSSSSFHGAEQNNGKKICSFCAYASTYSLKRKFSLENEVGSCLKSVGTKSTLVSVGCQAASGATLEEVGNVGAGCRASGSGSSKFVGNGGVVEETRTKKTRLEEENAGGVKGLLYSVDAQGSEQNLEMMSNSDHSSDPVCQFMHVQNTIHETERSKFMEVKSVDHCVDVRLESNTNVKRMGNVNDENAVSAHVEQEKKANKPRLKEKLDRLKEKFDGLNVKLDGLISNDVVIAEDSAKELKVNEMDHLKFMQSKSTDASIDGIAGANFRRSGNVDDEGVSQMESGSLDFVGIGKLEEGRKAKKPRLEENSDRLCSTKGSDHCQKSLSSELCNYWNGTAVENSLKVLKTHQSVDDIISITDKSPKPAECMHNELVEVSKTQATKISYEAVHVNANTTNRVHIQSLGEKSGGLSSNEVAKAKDVEIGEQLETRRKVNNSNKSGVNGDSGLLKIQQSVHVTDGISISSKVKDRGSTGDLAKLPQDCLQDNNLKINKKGGEIGFTRNGPDGVKLQILPEWMCPKPSSRNISFKDAPSRSPSAVLTILDVIRALSKEPSQVIENEHILDVAARRGYTFPRWRSSPTH